MSKYEPLWKYLKMYGQDVYIIICGYQGYLGL